MLLQSVTAEIIPFNGDHRLMTNDKVRQDATTPTGKQVHGFYLMMICVSHKW